MNITRRQFLRDTAKHDWAPGQRRRYARQFEQSVERLGSRWLLAQPQPRRATSEPAPLATIAAAIRQWRDAA